MAEAHPRAPELSPALRWLNAAGPFDLQHDLGGHVVLVCFWATSCLHSLQTLPVLQYLEQRYAGRPFAVLGVHTGKFAGEHDAEHVRMAIDRYRIRHPVLADTDRSTWQRWGCRAWPTLALVDSRGRLRFQGAGEPARDRMVAAIDQLLAEANRDGTAVTVPKTGIADLLPPAGTLRFPTRVAVDAARGWLWIAETGRHRVLAVDLASGAVQHVAGAGVPGAGDGPLELATFHQPRGLAVDGSTVFVADTGNHLVRRIDLVERRVTTVAGIGRAARDLAGGREGDDQGLDAPWGLCLLRGALYLAMAGTHQVWRLDPATRRAVAFAGSGGEGLLDGTPQVACFAQPSGIAAHGERLLVADAASSSIRSVDRSTGQVQTLVDGQSRGADPAAGPGALQYPLDVAFAEGGVLIADTLADAIARFDPDRGTTTRLVAAGAGLRRPEGLAVFEGTVWVADTGNHRVVRVDLATGAVTPLEVQGLVTLDATRRGPHLQLRRSSELNLRVQLPLAEGARLVPATAVRARLWNQRGRPLLGDVTLTADVLGDDALLRAVPAGEDGDGEFGIELSYMTCHQSDATTHLQGLRCIVPVTVGAEGYSDVTL